MEKSVCFKNTSDLPKNTEFIFINCTMRNMKNKKTKKIYENTHAMVISKTNSNKNPESKFQKNEILTNLPRNQTVDDLFSVLIFGIDSISNLNLRRTMPKTVRYLNDTGWLYLDGYTKVAENTFPNLIPILTGLNVDKLTKKCWNVSDFPLDNCPFIWKEYKLKSYLTAYVEDEPTIGTFNFHKYGFLNAPTDYYTRPYMLASEKLLKVKTINSLNYCLGEQSSAERILEYCQDFIRTLKKNPFFGLFWTNTFSHNELNQPSSMDERMRKFFQDISKILNNHTLVIFLSDHGMRWGGIRTTFTGWLEERMPFIYFWIPEEFKKKFPEKYSNLLKNKNRLTSPFDLYLTLSDILNNNKFVNPADGGEYINQAVAESCPKCKSLFSEIPRNRNCKDAAIPYEWCTCASDFVNISIDDSVVKLIVNYILKKINQRLTVVNKSGYKIRKGTKCAYLNLHKITSAEKQLADSSNHMNDTYLIVLQANPSRAIFEATVTVKSDIKNFSVLYDSVSRISTYGSQSYCAEEYGIKMYCYCIHKS